MQWYPCMYVCVNEYADVSLTEWLRYSAGRMHARTNAGAVEILLDLVPATAAQNLPLLPGAYDMWISESPPTPGTYGPQMCAALLVDH